MVISQQNSLYTLGISLLLLIALGIFLIYDLIAALSVYLQFTLIYALFWLVLGALLLRRTPRQWQLSLLVLFASAITAISLINWDSRKPFLRHFYQIEVGMTAAQTDQVMQGYMKFTGPTTQVDEHGEVLNGPVSYRHTEDGWGDSDVGLIIFKNGRVVETSFYPD